MSRAVDTAPTQTGRCVIQKRDSAKIYTLVTFTIATRRAKLCDTEADFFSLAKNSSQLLGILIDDVITEVVTFNELNIKQTLVGEEMKDEII